ncbi:MAG: hypothetical protein FD130_2251, partial [Halothiobacillaceae bacterium]
MTTSQRPPEYTVRISARSKRARIEVSHQGAVQVVVPLWFSLQGVPTLIEHHKKWLQRSLTRLQQRGVQAAVPPSQILLPAIDEQWQLHYMADKPPHEATTSSSCKAIIDSTNRAFYELPPEPHRYIPLLQQWLQQRATEVLPRWLTQLSSECALPFNRVTIRHQKTRWGSCSARGNINLNRNLLLLDPAVVRYLLLHELCHTRHLNHSIRYWQL